LVKKLDASLRASEVTCLGISTQRCSFITWSKVSGQHFHNLITWQDLRADQLVKRWDSSITVKALNSSLSSWVGQKFAPSLNIKLYFYAAGFSS